MKTIAFFNLKGGVGKTVSTVNVAAVLAMRYKKSVLVIDADSQGNTTMFFDGDPSLGNLATVLKARFEHAVEVGFSSIQQTETEGIDLLAASDELMDLDISAIKGGAVNVSALREIVAEATGDGVYDYILIDCPPAFNAATAAALLAADEVIIPIKLDAFSLTGMANLTRQVANMRKINTRIRVAGCLVTMFYKDDTIAEALQELKRSPLPVFDTVIRRTGKVDGTTFARSPLIIHSPRSAAGVDYRRFVSRHIIKEGAGRNV